MKLSARNQIPGKIVAVQKGQTTAHVRIDIGNGVIVTSSNTNEVVQTAERRRWLLFLPPLSSRVD